MRHFKNPYPEYTEATGDPKAVYPDDRIKADLGRLLSEIIVNRDAYKDAQSGGMYTGTAGVAFAMWYAAKERKFCSDAEGVLKLAKTLAKRNKRNMLEHRDKYRAGFLHGRSGGFAMHVVTSLDERDDIGGVVDSARCHAAICADACASDFDGCDELLFGRAGYLCGAMWLKKRVMSEAAAAPQAVKESIVKEEDLVKLSKELIKSGRRHALRSKMPSPLMYSWHEKEYLGAAHGLSAILQMLLAMPRALSEDELEDVKTTVDYLISIQGSDGNIPSSMGWVSSYSGRSRKEEDQLVHWCHGAAGVVYLFARAYIVFGGDKYLAAAVKCGECVWRKGLLKKGPGICHGISGGGYVFLTLYRLTNFDRKWLYRARRFAHFMATSEEYAREARMPDRPFSLFEGSAGAVCFLADLLHQETAEFPFFGVSA